MTTSQPDPVAAASTVEPIPFHQPLVTGNEQAYLEAAIRHGSLAGDGPFSRRCCEWLERLGIARALLTPSCTAALEMAAILANIGPGDEVIMPSFTFVTTATAMIRCGATPVFVDIRDDTLNLDERLVEAAVTDRTRAIVPVHYGGVACDLQPLIELAQRRGLQIIEDAAQAVTATYRGKSLGGVGDLAAFSFHATKNLNCGEGGALCVNDPELIERAEIVRDKGTNRRQFFRGQVDKYTWVDVGSSFLSGELSAAYLLAQLESAEAIQSEREELHHRYLDLLKPLVDRGHIRLPVIPDDCRSSYHLFAIRVTDPADRDRLLAHLRDRGIQATFHYVPLHNSPMGSRVGRAADSLAVTEQAAAALVRLPLFNGLTAAQQQRVAEAVTSFFERPAR